MTNPQSPATAVSQYQKKTNDPRNREVVHAGASPFEGNLATPINASRWSIAYLNNLPAYRKGLTPMRRGLEVGMAHGYWLIGPFATFGPLRDTRIANLAALLSTIGLLIISTLAISLYAASQPPAPTTTLTTTNPPAALQTESGWQEYARGFLIGGIGGAVFAYFVLGNVAFWRHLLG
jgi:photosystem I subunit 11